MSIHARQRYSRAYEGFEAGEVQCNHFITYEQSSFENHSVEVLTVMIAITIFEIIIHVG